jgi:hypothetical protein
MSGLLREWVSGTRPPSTLFECFSCPSQARRRGTRRDADDLGDLWNLEPFELEQDEYRPEIRGQRIEQILQEDAQALLIEEFVGAGGVVNPRVHFVVRALVPRGGRASLVRRDADGRCDEEGAFPTLLDSRQLRARDQKHVLSGVLDGRRRDAQVSEYAPDFPVVAANQGADPMVRCCAGFRVRIRKDTGSPKYAQQRLLR